MSGYVDALEGHLTILRFWREGGGSRVIEKQREPDGSVAVALSYVFHKIMQAETYYVGPEICDLLLGAAKGVPNTAEFDPSMWPSPEGFVWLAKPLPVSVPSIRGKETAVRAYTWFRRERTGVDGLAIMTYEEEEAYPTFPGVTGALFIPLKDSLDDLDFVFTDEGREPTSQEDGEDLARFHYTLLSFMRDSIVHSEDSRATRAVRRRMPPDWRPDPVIRVIQLRRVHSVSAANEASGAEWSCRWLVGGHWRNQWYPSMRKHQPKYIAPYVKGPDDKPLRQPRARVFAVVR